MNNQVPQGKIRKVLIVEPDVSVSMDLDHMLRGFGYEVYGAVSSGEAAVQAVRGRPPDLALIAIGLSGEIDGIETAARIRSLADIPVAHLVSADEEDRLERAAAGETYGFLGKPISLIDLRITVETALHKHAADKRIRESEARRAKAEELAGLHSWEWDLTTDRLTWSAEAYRAFGYKEGPEDLTFARFLDSVHPEDRDRIRRALEETAAGKAAYDIIFRIVRPNGDVRRLHSKGEVKMDGDGNPVRVVGMALDITERAELEEERDRILSMSYDLICVACEDGYLKYVNPSWERVLGYTADELLSRPFLDLIHPDDHEKNEAEVLKLKSGEPTEDFRNRYIHKDGSIRIIDWTSVAIPEKGLFYCVGRDVTDRREAEEAFEAAYERLNQILEFLPDPTFVIDDRGRVTTWNRAMEQLTGVEASAIVGRGDYEYALPFYGRRRPLIIDLAVDYDPQWASQYESLRREGDRLITEVYLPDFRGGRWLWITAAPLVDENGRIVGAVETIRDITEIKDTEETLRRSEERYRLLAENTLDVIWQMDTELRFTYINPAILHMTGFTQEEWIGSKLDEHCDNENFAALARAVAAEIAKGPGARGVVFEADMITKNGDPIPVEIHGKVIFDGSGLPVALQGVTRDITERRKAQAALKESERKYRRLFQNSPVGIISVDTEGRILEINRYLLDTLGSPSEEATKAINMLTLPQLVRSGVSAAFRYCMVSGRRVVKEIPYESKWGKKSYLRFVLTPIADEAGAVSGCQAVVEDFSEQKRLEEQLREASKMEAVGTLAGGIAHDFNNLLQIISGHAEMLDIELAARKSNLSEVNAIRQAADRGADLVRQILTFSRKVESRFQSIDLNHYIRSTERLLYRTIPKMIEIGLDLAEDLRLVRADSSQIEQMLINLAINSKDAMPDGGELIIATENVDPDEDYCRTHESLEPGAYVRLSVTDTGHGIDEEALPRIFEPFFTTKKPGEGTGLGLSSVFGIVKMHGGHIMVESEPGAGTTMAVYLPASKETPPDAEKTDQEARPGGGTETLLVVDDEPLIADLAKKLLERAGYSVVAAHNGRQALDIYTKERDRISLVILDLVMPEMGGRQCLEELLKIDPEVKVLIAGGFVVDDEAKAVLDSAAKGVVSKPFVMNTLLRSVREVLDGT